MIKIAKIADPRWSGLLFVSALMVMYVLAPLVLSTMFQANPYYIKLSKICLFACLGISAGFCVPLFDQRFKSDGKRIVINQNAFHLIIWSSFFIFVAVTFYTASSIPFVSAFLGADANELSQQRGDFLKGRAGFELILLYMSAIFISTLLPYSLVNLFVAKSRYRFFLMLSFLIFSVSFLQKALFFNLLIPIGYMALRRLKISRFKLLCILLASVILLYFITILAFGAGHVFEGNGQHNDIMDFFLPSHVSGSAFEYIVWRSVAVPIFTATDALLVFNEQFHNQPLMGATSLFLAKIFSMERINIERYIFEHQFGSWNEIANANSVFVTDGYVNFGWVGVLLFSLFVGQSLRWFWKSKDEGFKSLWLLYCFTLYSGPLISLLLSNGYFYMFLHALFFKLKISPSTKTYPISSKSEIGTCSSMTQACPD